MTPEQGRPDSSEIRRALDNLQQTLETLSARYQELRRERGELRSRIEELEQERENENLSVSTRLEAAAIDRRRVSELELRVIGAEKGQAELYERIAELETMLGERDAVIVEQEETIVGLRARIESDRKREEEGWGLEERLRDEIAALNDQLSRARSASELAESRLLELESSRGGSVDTAAIGELRSKLEDYGRLTESLQSDRARLEEQQMQLIGKLDAATRDSGLARTRVAELESQLRGLEELQPETVRLSDLARESAAALEATRRELQAARQDAASRQQELGDLYNAALAREAALSEQVTALQRRLLAAEMENEGAAKAVADLMGQRDQAREKVDMLLTRLTLVEASDDDRLKVQRDYIDSLTRDLTEALDMAAKKETEAVEAGLQVERLQAELAGLRERAGSLLAECESLRAQVTAGGGAEIDRSRFLPEEERTRMVRQISEAIRLIDKHL
jgi:chromosome segregation ATPase